MSSAAQANARAKPDALASLISRLPDPQDRDWYAELVSYIQSLPPQDELVKLAQLFGFLTLLGRELPEALAAEQAQLRELLLKAHNALHQDVQTYGQYHEQLKERLSKLPGEIAEGVQPERIAKAMGESFRQQLAATGIGEVQTFLTGATRDLKRAAGDVDAAVKPIAGRYGTLANDIETKITALTSATTKLQSAAKDVNSTALTLRQELRQLEWWIVPVSALALLLAGGFLGASWEQRQATDSVLELQGQVQQLQEAIKALPGAAPNGTNSKRSKNSPRNNPAKPF